MRKSTGGVVAIFVAIFVAILVGLSTAFVRVVVERHARAHARSLLAEPSRQRDTDEAWRRRGGWTVSPTWPALPPTAISETLPPVSSEAAPPSESAAVQAARRAVALAVAGHPGTTLTSMECTPEPCGAVIEAGDSRELRAAVLDVTAAYNGHVEVDLRERDDQAHGHVFHAAVAVGTPTAETVAALDSEF